MSRLDLATLAPFLQSEEKDRRLLAHSFSRLEDLFEEGPELPVQSKEDRLCHIQQFRVGEDACESNESTLHVDVDQLHQRFVLDCRQLFFDCFEEVRLVLR